MRVRTLCIALITALSLSLFPAMGLSAPPSPPSAWLTRYLTLDTSAPKGEEEAALYLRNLLARHGLSSELIYPPSRRPSLVANLPPTEGAGGTLVLLHHMDVVPAEADWSFEPYGGEVVDGLLQGRGAVDAKSLGIAQLQAFIAASHMRERKRGLMLVAVPDEEQGGGEGTGWLLENQGERFDDVIAVLNEGGTVRKVNGKVFFWGIEIAQKRPLWLRVQTRGLGGHGSSYRPSSATHQLIKALGRLLEAPPRWRITPEARQYFQALAPFYNKKYQKYLKNPELLLESEKTLNLEPNLLRLMVDTLQVNVLKGSEKTNTTPSSASAEIDIRLLPDTDEKAFLNRIRERLGSQVEVEVLLSSPPTKASPLDAAIYQLLDKYLSPEATTLPFFAAGTTDSRFFRQRGIPAYGFSPFPLEPQELRGIHGVDESIPLEIFEEGVERLENIVLAWVRGEGNP